MKKKKLKKRGDFWDEEYKSGEHLTLSKKPAEDLVRFSEWLVRNHGKKYLNVTASVLDLGCGNGRNLIHLANTYGVHGVGFDISGEAIAQAKESSKNLQLAYEVRSIAEPLPVGDQSQTIVLDMMTSHFLRENDRKELLNEIMRVLKPGGWLFYKTFLLDGDKNAAELLREHPGSEPGTYLHPIIGLEEHVSTEEEIEDLLSEHFSIERVLKSHRHLQRGKAHKRRSISVYAQKVE